jgi:hypothetical protein
VRSVRAYCKRVPYELPAGHLPKFRQLIHSVPNLSFTKFTIHDHRIRSFEPALAHSPAVDTLRVYSNRTLPVSASSTTFGRTASSNSTVGTPQPCLSPCRYLSSAKSSPPCPVSLRLSLVTYRIPYVQGEHFTSVRRGRPFSFAFSLRSLNATRRALEPFLAALRPYAPTRSTS